MIVVVVLGLFGAGLLLQRKAAPRVEEATITLTPVVVAADAEMTEAARVVDARLEALGAKESTVQVLDSVPPSIVVHFRGPSIDVAVAALPARGVLRIRPVVKEVAFDAPATTPETDAAERAAVLPVLASDGHESCAMSSRRRCSGTRAS